MVQFNEQFDELEKLNEEEKLFSSNIYLPGLSNHDKFMMHRWQAPNQPGRGIGRAVSVILLIPQSFSNNYDVDSSICRQLTMSNTLEAIFIIF
jgi:hypothetical protein